MIIAEHGRRANSHARWCMTLNIAPHLTATSHLTVRVQNDGIASRHTVLGGIRNHLSEAPALVLQTVSESVSNPSRIRWCYGAGVGVGVAAGCESDHHDVPVATQGS